MARKKVKSQVSHGQAHITAKFGNTLVSITDSQGNVISWSSAGACGFKGSRKGTPYAAQKVAEIAIKAAIERGLTNVDVFVRGPGAGRDSAIRIIKSCGVNVDRLVDVTPIPHNGCRPPKKRRV